MSVSALDRPVSNPPPRPLPPKPELKSKDVSPSLVSGQKADRVSFNSSDDKPGKVFAAHASTTKERADGNASQGCSRQSAASDTQPPGFFDKFKQNLKGWCGGQRPPKPDPCRPAPCNAKPPKPCPPERPKPDPCYSKPPERPTPCKPDPCNGKPPERPTPCKPEPCRYERNDELARELLDNFDAFRDSSCRTYITKQDIERVAGQRPTGIEATDIKHPPCTCTAPASRADTSNRSAQHHRCIERQNLQARNRNDPRQSKSYEVSGRQAIGPENV